MGIHIDHTQREGCRHEPRTYGRTTVVACGECGLLEFFGARGLLDPAEGIAALFGNYDLVSSMAAVGAPARRVLVYRPPMGRKGALTLLPEGAWLRAGADLWIASDQRTLMLATSNELMVDNLTRGA